METIPKYKYPEAVPIENRTWPDKQITAPPIWSSVDLRDGNQALPIPMNPETKLKYFQMLLDIGFKDIEVGFPSASQDDFDFVRKLIEEDLIPDGVSISVLTQARKHLIDRTVESLKGVKKAILHCYVASSDLHGQVVFGMDHEQVLQMSIDGTQMVHDAIVAAGLKENVGYEFTPEEFTDSDLDFTVDICNAVKETWGETKPGMFMINLAATVERRPAYQYADMVELFCRKYKYRDETIISLHAHNDQGCAIASTEMALLAGADRVEGTIFGHGERTGNLDVSVLSLNFQSRGIKTGLDFSNMPAIVRLVEEASNIAVAERHPYAGQLVFTAFSGSHQDAIRKGLDRRDLATSIFGQTWKVPYLHIDPDDVGRSYEKLIRINSQSGKGGIAYVLENEFGIYAPKAMHAEIGAMIQQIADKKGIELDSKTLFLAFNEHFINIENPYTLIKLRRIQRDDISEEKVAVKLDIKYKGEALSLEGIGNGPISAAVHALKENHIGQQFTLEDFTEQSLGKDADAKALAFVGIRVDNEKRPIYGAGEHCNIDQAAIQALFTALNRAELNK
jgi:2-isopropylmalate synthase